MLNNQPLKSKLDVDEEKLVSNMETGVAVGTSVPVQSKLSCKPYDLAPDEGRDGHLSQVSLQLNNIM